MSEKLSRREFLNLNWESTVGFLGNFLAPQIEMERDFFRPPGSCDELEFLTTCTRCGKCQNICPENCISIFTLSSGVKLVNTPFIDPNEIPCTFCKQCIDVCPTASLSYMDFRAHPFLGTVMVEKTSCLGFQQVLCDYCVRACPVYGAISIIEGIPLVSEQKCTGCGICIASCIAEEKALKIVLKSL
ncbi:MAG: 4Fe-4S dicluster domain-containing protein [Bacillus sp. (in: Bacteria)]|nr:4Fe-4S dicluster domain-containing protein [Bacillus sp. (in: firmicutes)]